MKPMMESRYVGWMAVRPLTFGDEEFAPGDRIPQKHLDGMRDPEVLVRTGRIAAVAKDMNKVPRMLRKDVVEEEEMRERILAPRIASQIGEIKTNHQVAVEKRIGVIEDEPRGVGGSAPGYNPDVAHVVEQETEDAEGGPIYSTPYPTPETPAITVADPLDTTGDKEADNVMAEEGPRLDETAGQEPVETDTTEDAGATVNPISEPNKNASTEEWAAFAVGSGATEEEIDGMNRTELIAKYATPEPPE